MKGPTAFLLLVMLALTVGGCATAPRTSGPAPAASPSVRCVSDPNERGTRPLIFLFCIQSP
jgi:hypothetical protein